MHRLKRSFALVLVLCLLCAAAPAAHAAWQPPEPPQPLRLYYSGMLAGTAYVENGMLFLPLENLCVFLGLPVQILGSETAGSYSAVGNNFLLSCEKGSHYTVANHRCLYSPEEYRFYEGELYLPQNVMEKAFSLNAAISPDEDRVDVDISTFAVIRGGVDYYASTFSNDDLTWLSQIIYAEARLEPLEGKIAVGNVVLNRVASEKFPNSIYDVVFYTNNAWQFTPAQTGAIYTAPDEQSVAAACMCLEGASVAGKCLYFMNPWAANTADFQAYTLWGRIGNHNFYY